MQNHLTPEDLEPIDTPPIATKSIDSPQNAINGLRQRGETMVGNYLAGRLRESDIKEMTDSIEQISQSIEKQQALLTTLTEAKAKATDLIDFVIHDT